MVRAPPSLETLAAAIPPIFMQCQTAMHSHKKNVVNLYKIHAQTSDIWEEVPPRGIRLTGEKAFNDRFLDMVNRILNIKKGVSEADRVVKFIGSFVAYISQKAAEEKEKNAEEEDDDDDEDTPTSRFVAALLKHLMKGFQAKDKNVRYRVCQVVAEMIFSLGEMDEDLYTALRSALLERVRDKETYVRLQAVIALARLQRGEEGSDQMDENEESLTEVLIDVLQYDPVAEVRRAALLNLAVSPATIPAVISRTRDQDNTLRKIVYHHVLSSLPSPLVLSIGQREEIARNGLGDREPTVRTSAGRLIGGWVDSVGGLEGFLKMLDVTTSKVAEDALFSAFVTRPDLFEDVEFPEVYWTELTPERAFLARVFVDHCIAIKDDVRLESSLPVVTALAFRIQHEYNALSQLSDASIGSPGASEADDREMQRGDKEFIVAELLRLAVNLDYADETGRRKMFALVRDMTSQEALPEILVTRCLDVLRTLSSSERDLFMLVVEIVHELQDSVKIGEDPPERAEGSQFGDDASRMDEPRRPSRESVQAAVEVMDPETRDQWEYINLRCLALCIGMLERVNGTLEDNSVLDGLLQDFVLPAIQQKHPLWRERGITLLGLMCLISKNMAARSALLFAGQAKPSDNAPRGYSEIQLRALQMLFDIVMVFHVDVLGEDGAEKIIDVFQKAMQSESSPEVHAAACEGMAKLMLSGIITDEAVLTNLVELYINPATSDNPALRQCLSYFFPVYCYSSPLNQRRMQRIFITLMDRLSNLHDELDEDEEMVPPAQIGAMLADWTDPAKTVELDEAQQDSSVHLDMAIDIIKALFEKEMEKDRKKVLAQLLGKLHIPDEADDDKVKQLKLLIANLRRRRPLQDTTARNALTKFDTTITKKYAQQLEDFGEEEYRQLEQLKSIFDFLDEIVSDSEEEIDMDKPTSRRSDKPASRSTRSKSASAPVSKNQGKKKSAEEAKLDEEISDLLDSDKEEEEVTSDPEVASTPAPKRDKKPTSRKKPVEQDSEDSDEDEDEDPSPPRRPSAPARKQPRKKQVTPVEEEEGEEESEDPAPPPKRRRTSQPEESEEESDGHEGKPETREEEEVEGDLFDEEEDD